jgi:hypothetical protein
VEIVTDRMMRVFPVDDAGSFAWIAHPDERMQRASSAVVTSIGTLVIDPVDCGSLDDALSRLGPVAGVVQLLDRHNRDVAAVAARLSVPVLVPGALAGRGEPLAIPGVQERVVLAMPGWKEAALWFPERGLLVCAEAIGTAPYYRARDTDVLGVHPFLRMRPPMGALSGVAPSVIVVGHGPPVVDDAASALVAALRQSRRDLPRAWLRGARLIIRRTVRTAKTTR